MVSGTSHTRVGIVMWLLVTTMMAGSFASRAHAQSDDSPDALAVSLAILPGVHGSGHLATGDTATALKLFGWQLASGSVMTAAMLTGLQTGPPGQIVALLYPSALFGMASMIVTWFADIWGVVTRGHGLGAPVDFEPRYELQLGYRFLYDEQFPEHHFTQAAAVFRFDRVRVYPQLLTAVDLQRVWGGADVAVRIFDKSAGAMGTGTFLEAEVGISYERSAVEGISILTPHGLLRGRLDLQELGHTLRGSFAQAEIGYGVQLFDYDLQGLDLGEDRSEVLRLRTEFGVYLGHHPSRAGEIVIFYDHRHDGFVGGLQEVDAITGWLGHVGLRGKVYVSDHFAIAGDVRYGSSLLVGARLAYRVGGY